MMHYERQNSEWEIKAVTGEAHLSKQEMYEQKKRSNETDRNERIERMRLTCKQQYE
jgi:hypothetical protein